MDMIEARRRVLMAQPHQVTVSGSFVHFVTDMAAPLIITGTGNITICGKNLFNIEDDARIMQALNDNGQTRYVYNLGASGCTVYFSATVKTAGSYVASSYYESKYYDTTGKYRYPSTFLKSTGDVIAHSRSFTATEVAVISAGLTKTEVYNDLVKYNIQCEVGNTQTAFEPYTGTTAAAGTPRKSLVGINNIWSDSGSVTVTYWTH